ncbi:MAG: hypothetical protein HY298_06665 [Verrucomicrobia bacterium]|nr:hypothetical protein [Verrucomicrobiota bacterium]
MKNELPLNLAPTLDDSKVDATLNVVIAYDDIPAGQRAMRTLANLTRGIGDEIEFRPQLWRFEFLEDPDWRAVAAAETINADILIISTSSETELPVVVESWVRSCLAQKRDDTIAVVALLGSADKTDKSDSQRYQFMQRAARDGGFDFFAPSARHEDSSDSTIESIRQRAETVTPILDDILQVPTHSLNWRANP